MGIIQRSAIALGACAFVFLATNARAQTSSAWGTEFTEVADPIEGSTVPLNQPAYYYCSGPDSNPGITTNTPCTAQYVNSYSLVVDPINVQSPNGHASDSGNGTAALGSLTSSLEGIASAPWGSPQMSASAGSNQYLYWMDTIVPNGAPSTAVQFKATLILSTMCDSGGGATGSVFATVSGLGVPLGTSQNILCYGTDKSPATFTYTQVVTLSAGQAFTVQGLLQLIASVGSPVGATNGGYADSQGQNPGAVATFCLDPINNSSYVTASQFTYLSVNGICQGGFPAPQIALPNIHLELGVDYTKKNRGMLALATATDTNGNVIDLQDAATDLGFDHFNYLQQDVSDLQLQACLANSSLTECADAGDTTMSGM